jgi:hypothetical protein
MVHRSEEPVIQRKGKKPHIDAGRDDPCPKRLVVEAFGTLPENIGKNRCRRECDHCSRRDYGFRLHGCITDKLDDWTPQRVSRSSRRSHVGELALDSLADLLNMTVVGAATASQDIKGRQFVDQGAVLFR